jgi:hypothetical protein
MDLPGERHVVLLEDIGDTNRRACLLRRAAP